MRVRIMIGLLFVLLIGISQTLPLAAQNASWTAEFFNNRDFSGGAVTATYSALSLDWDREAPVSGINADNFSARFRADAAFTTSGTYKFTLRADDTAKLFINGTQILTVDEDGETVTADVTIAAGNVPMIVEYVENTSDAYIFLSWSLTTASTTTTPSTAIPTTPVVTTGWTIQYFSGTTLSGPVLATVPINAPQLNWGTGSPNTSVPFDYFSARLTKSEPFIPGVHRFEVRADDGVRVFINGQKIIDRWTASDGAQTYTADVSITGPSTIFIEYFELTNNASLYYNSYRLPDGSIPSADAGSSGSPNLNNGSVTPMTAQGRITAGTLNVREVPSTSGRVLTKVYFGQNYSVVGTNADRSWYQIHVAQFNGWVNARFIRITQSSIPITAPTNAQLAVPNPVLAPVPPVVAPQAVSTGYFLTATANVVIRNAPSLQATRGGLVPMSASAEILGRNSTNTWWYVTQNLQVGWVSGAYVFLPANMDLARVPVLQP